MKLNIKTTNISITPAIEDYLNKKLSALDKIVDQDSDNVLAQVDIGKTSQHHKSGDIFRAQINLRTHGNEFRAVSEKEDLYAAIDDMKDEIVREVKTGKEKWMTNMKKGGAEAKKKIHNGDGVDNSSEE